MASESEILEGYKAVTVASEEDKKSQRSFYAQLEAVADMKFTYVATCQNYGNQKRSGDCHGTDILNLMVNNPCLHVAYIDEVEERNNGKVQKVYYSVLVKALDNLDQLKWQGDKLCFLETLSSNSSFTYSGIFVKCWLVTCFPIVETLVGSQAGVLAYTSLGFWLWS